jgi:hypothetical protein
MTVKGYRDLIAWQKAMDLVEQVYKITRGFPKEDLYGLTSQVRRAAVSIPSNIAEGHCRNGRREFIHHLLGYLTDSASILEMASETGRLLVGLMHSLERHAAAS